MMNTQQSWYPPKFGGRDIHIKRTFRATGGGGFSHHISLEKDNSHDTPNRESSRAVAASPTPAIRPSLWERKAGLGGRTRLGQTCLHHISQL